LLDRDGRLAGFEFCLPEAMTQRLTQRGDLVAHGAHAVALLSAMKPTLAAGRIALAALPLAVLARSQVTSQVPAGAMLVLTDSPFTDPAAGDAIAALTTQGAIVGALGQPAPGAHFVLIEGAGLDGRALQAAATACRAAAANTVTLVASGIGDLDDLEFALRHGFDLASGVVDRSAPPRAAAALPPDLQRVAQLLNLVTMNADTAAIAIELRNDVRLTYQLLRYANSPLLGLSRAVDSADQALMLLGRDAVYRWLSMLLLAGTAGRSTSHALQEIALSRARLLEALADAIGAPPAGLFTTGLLSLLDVMLGVPMADALKPLNLAAPARQALLEHAGPWHAALELARALERNDLVRAELLAAGLGGMAAATHAADEAWHWANLAAAELRQP
jgi:c-di-GMP phosphodiesterase